MKIAATRKYDTANGPGIRATMFVSGCTHNCKGCFNQEYKDFQYGTECNQTEVDKFMSYVNDPNVKGITILGGEPFDQDEDLLNLIKTIKDFTTKSLWIYSGYTFETLIKRPMAKEILQLCDALVDGPFVDELKDFRLKFRGSSNQRIIDLQRTFIEEKIVQYNF